MRHRNLWAGGLALGLGLCVVGIALGQAPAGSDGNWFSRLFSRGTPAPAPPDDRKNDKPAPVVSPAAQRAQALADYLRRLDVCLKLKEIAFENGDTELARRAEQLEQRAKDAYDQRTNRAGGVGSFDEEKLASHLVPQGKNRTPLTAGSMNSAGGQASAEGGR